jgi:multidrug efflux system membrane fusion protein
MFVKKNRLTIIAGALLAIGASAVIVIHNPDAAPIRSAHAETAAPPAQEVDVATVINKQVAEWQGYSGRLEAVDKVDIRPLVGGKIVAVHFADGALVKKGDLLFTIDPRPYEAELARANAQLAAVEARNGYASADSTRATRLLASNAIAQRDADERLNAAREAAAQMSAARAAVEAARINLAYTAVTAPVSGRVSRAELTVGNVVSGGGSAPVLTTLVSVSPIYASFEVDEQTYLRYLRHGAGKPLPVTLGLADETGYSRDGAVVSVDNRMDAGSATIRVRARFDNADGSLVPGLYARVKVGGGTPEDAVLIDDAAIGTDQAKNFVLVVDAQNKVQYREVRLGNLHEGMRIVASGLAAGERIIVNGTLRAKPNDTVRAHVVPMTGAAKPAA